MEATNFEHPLPSRIPESNFSYSDHEAIMASFKLVKGKDWIGNMKWIEFLIYILLRYKNWNFILSFHLNL